MGVSAALIGAISFGVRGVVGEADHRERERGAEVELLGHERRRRCAQPGEEHAALVGQVAHELAREPEQVGALFGAEQEQPEMHQRPDLVQT